MSNYKPTNNSDELNQNYLFNMTANELLVAIAQGKIDAKELATIQLAQRGYDANGIYVGFGKK